MKTNMRRRLNNIRKLKIISQETTINEKYISTTANIDDSKFNDT